MIVYDLQDFAKELRERLLASKMDDTVEKVAIEIKYATHPDGSFLTMAEQEKVVFYIRYKPVNDDTDSVLLQETDNTEFLKLVAIVANIIKGNK